MEKELLQHSFLGNTEEEKEKIELFLKKKCNIEEEDDESDYEEAEITNKLRREGKMTRQKRTFQPPTIKTVVVNKDSINESK